MEGFGKNLFGFVLVFTLVSIFMICYTSAANFTANISPTSVNGSLSNQFFNVTINNTDSVENIIQVNITLPGGFTFVTGSNQTSASNVTFWNMTWDNTTSSGFIDINGTVEYFAFNSSTPNSSGNYMITVYVLDTNYTSNSTSLNVTVDADAPSVVLNYPGNNTNNTNSTMTFNFTTTDVIDGNLTCNLTIDGSVNQSGFGAESGNVTIKTVSGLSEGQHNWSVTCWDDFNHVTTTNASFFGLYPDLIVTAINWTSTPNNRTGAGSNVTFKATIYNNASFNASETINVSLWWGGTFIENKENVSALTAGSSQVITFTEITDDPTVTNGLHDITVVVDYNESVAEANETNNNRTLQFLVGYNVTIMNISPSSINASLNVTVNISVEYTNGDPVNDTTVYNITLLDKYSGSTVDTWNSADSVFSSSFNASEKASGYYSFNITSYYVYNSPKPGVHNLSVTASRDNYSGTSSGLDYYFLTVPDFSIQISGLVTTLQEGNADSFTVTVKNIGNSTAYNVKVYPVDLSYVTVTPATSPLYTMSSGQAKNSGLQLTASSVDDSLIGSFRLRVSAISSNGTSVFNATSSLFTITVTDSAADGDGLLDGGGATGCSDDDDCPSGYYCSGGTCYLHQYAISITSYQSLVKVNWSSYVTTSVTVKNTGQKSMTGKLMVTMGGMNITVLPSSFSKDTDVSSIFIVNISVPETAVLGNHSGTFKAYVNEDTNVYQTKTFTLNVLSTPEKEEEINETYHNYSTTLDDLKERFDRLKAIGFINESNLTEVELLLNASIQSMDDLKEALNELDYESADLLLETINTSLSNLGSEIEGLELTQQEQMGGELSGVWLWVVIGAVVVIVVGFLVYLLMPSFKGYHPRYGYKPVIKESFFDKMSKKFSRKPKKEKFKEPERPREEFRPAYREGYKKVSSEYKYKKGTFSKIKEKFKRKKKQKEVSEYFGSR
ncbi:MAG: hypothetical protein JSW41_03340 [Candidatus Aenigmatarchaeota archaeon]|nr:MAG: hypothetical protein JSW41_03340 [Candidatus Aenigmarchaeota archaeon]